MKSKEFLSTRKVAEMTGLSIGSVQKMVDKGVFGYYLTLGGHRRISTVSVQAYLDSRYKHLVRSWIKKINEGVE